jgi:hypothetical protein
MEISWPSIIDQGAIFPLVLASLFYGFSIKNFTGELNSLIISGASCNHVIWILAKDLAFRKTGEVFKGGVS